jgi:hypothetical protein
MGEDEENEELDDIYDDREDEYGEEAEEIQFRGSGFTGMSNGFSNLDIIHENPDDEQMESVSKSKSKSAHSSPP